VKIFLKCPWVYGQLLSTGHLLPQPFSREQEQAAHSATDTIQNSQQQQQHSITCETSRKTEGWWSGWSGRVAAWQERGPEFKLKPNKKKKYELLSTGSGFISTAKSGHKPLR
jgi:hypothetical protein